MPVAFRGPRFFLSNFFPCPVEVDGIVYPTSEHAFIAAKCLDPADRMGVLLFSAEQVNEAKRFGRKVKLRPDWDAIRIQVMRDILCAKFTQNPILGLRLIQTYDEHLVELNTWGDRFWGVDGTGENHLGRLLVDVRSELQETASAEAMAAVLASGETRLFMEYTGRNLSVLVTGGRNFDDRAFLFGKLDLLHKKRGIRLLVHGAARGADTLAELWARENQVNYLGVPAKWDWYGKAAGSLRNEEMLDCVIPMGLGHGHLKIDLGVAFPGGVGTANMVGLLKTEGTRVWDLREGAPIECPGCSEVAEHAVFHIGPVCARPA